MDKKTCHIVGAGDFAAERFSPKAGEYIIAADGGYERILSANCSPDMAIGDFDSLGRMPEGDNVRIFPVEKDDTDMMLAVKTALEKGFCRILLHGGTGGRADHTIANLQTLAYIAEHGAEGFLIGPDITAACVKDGALVFDESLAGDISVFCLGRTAEGVSIEGLKYTAEGIELLPSLPLGVSNSFVGKPARISVCRGVLTVIWHDTEGPLPVSTHDKG